HGAFIDDRPISIINPTTQDPVESVTISSEQMVQQGMSVETMVISWPQAKDATKYQVEWRKDNGTWLKLPLTGSNSAEVAGIYAGQYEARVFAISAFDISSLPTYSVLTELKGKQGKPPKLAYIHAEGILFGMKLTWLFPAVGALDTAYTEIEVSPDSTSNIAQLGLFAYPTTTHTIQGMQPNLRQFYRGRLIDRIGNVGDWSDWVSGVSSADASDVLELLHEQISESQLNKDLQTKIDHIETIDGEIGPIRQDIQNTKDQISQEIIDRQRAIQNAEDGLTQKINDSEEGILEVIDTVKKSSDQGIAAAQSEIKVVADGLKLTAEKTDGVYAQLNPPLIGSSTDLIGSDQGFAGTWSVQSAIIEGDLALSKRVDTTVAQINDVQAFAQQEVVARVEGQKATVDKIDTYIAENDTALASVRDSAKIAVDTSKANGELIQSMELELDDKASTGQLTQVKSEIEEDYNGKITAQTAKIDGVYAQINPPLIGSESDLIGNSGSYAGVWSEQSARIEGDLAQSIRTDQVAAQMNQNDALYQQQIKATADALSANVKLTETLQTTVGENKASIEQVSESVDGVYAQEFTKFDVNGHVAGHGAMNDGKVSRFTFNYDSIDFGAPVGIDGIQTRPLMVLQNNPITLPNGTVVPRGLYVEQANIGYVHASRIYADSLSAVSANLGTIITLKDPSKPNGARRVIQGAVTRVYDDNNVLRMIDGYWD
ncbi:MAG: phage tail protein, partial [Acinetobacter sp.]|nr:phage tail protein [Acinetobacter sp.]MDN5650626.1 phage tail protein [Acinetobacter sp.]